VRCMTCHGAYTPPLGNIVHVTYYGNVYGSLQGCYQCHGRNLPSSTLSPYYVQAGGFGLTSLPGDTGSMAAHWKFVHDAINDSLMPGANEACVACHTETPVNITWHHAIVLKLAARYSFTIWNETNYSAHYGTSDYEANGTYTVYVLGNATGYGAVKLTNGSYFYGGSVKSTPPSSKIYPGYPW